MPSSAYAAFSTVSLLPVPMAIRSGLAVSVRGRVSSSTPWSQLVGGDVSRRRRWSGYSTTKRRELDRESSLLPVFSALAVLASEFGERKRGGFRFLAPRTRPVRHRRAGRYRSRRLLLARAATTRRRRAWDGQVRRKSCPPAPPIAAMCWAACRRARSRLRGAVRESAIRRRHQQARSRAAIPGGVPGMPLAGDALPPASRAAAGAPETSSPCAGPPGSCRAPAGRRGSTVVVEVDRADTGRSAHFAPPHPR